MKRKPIKIDWEELEDAFTTEEEVVSFLDTVTGRVVLEGEGEEDGLDDEEEAYGRPMNAAPAPRKDDPMRIVIHPPDATRKIEWMQGFVKDEKPEDKQRKEMIGRLSKALKVDDPASALSAILNEDPDLRDTWYLYRTHRLQRMIGEWLKSNDVEAVDPPPWK